MHAHAHAHANTHTHTRAWMAHPPDAPTNTPTPLYSNYFRRHHHCHHHRQSPRRPPPPPPPPGTFFVFTVYSSSDVSPASSGGPCGQVLLRLSSESRGEAVQWMGMLERACAGRDSSTNLVSSLGQNGTGSTFPGVNSLLHSPVASPATSITSSSQQRRQEQQQQSDGQLGLDLSAPAPSSAHQHQRLGAAHSGGAAGVGVHGVQWADSSVSASTGPGTSGPSLTPLGIPMDSAGAETDSLPTSSPEDESLSPVTLVRVKSSNAALQTGMLS